MSTLIPENVAILHREVQRKYGRLVLLLQQCERLMKALVVNSEVNTPVSRLLNIEAPQSKRVPIKTMGQVAGDLTKIFIRPTLHASDTEQSDESSCHPATEPCIRTSFQIEMSTEDVEQTKQKFAGMVELRNELVHHFLEKHDIWTESGCLAADTYLDDGFNKVLQHFEELKNWVKHLKDFYADTASFLASQEFNDWLFHGIMPGGAGVDWPSSTIVKLLRAAENALDKDGWTSLQNAINYIRLQDPEHNPKRYGCSNWRQVLRESEQFEFHKKQSVPGAPTETWYRSHDWAG